MADASSIENWLALNEGLLEIGKGVVAHLSHPEKSRQPPNAILAGFSRKAVKSLGAIQLLVKQGFWEEAQVLTRVIFELRATFDCFLKMLRDDPETACRRIFDAMTLEKMKQIRSYSNPSFQQVIRRPEWDKRIATVESRYSEKELAALKKHGFSGMSVEDRCRTAGHSNVYQIIYRNLSRNVHSTDFFEQIGGLFFDDLYTSGYRSIRDDTVLFVGNWSAGGIIIPSDIDDIFKDKIKSTQEQQKQLMKVFKTFALPEGDTT